MRQSVLVLSLLLVLAAGPPVLAQQPAGRVEVWLAERLARDSQDVLDLGQDVFEKGDLPAGDDWSAITALQQFNEKTHDLYLLGARLDAEVPLTNVTAAPAPPPGTYAPRTPLPTPDTADSGALPPPGESLPPSSVHILVQPAPALERRFRDLFWQCWKVSLDVQHDLYPSDLLQPVRAEWDDRIVPTLKRIRTALEARLQPSSTTFTLPSGRRVTIDVRYSRQ